MWLIILKKCDTIYEQHPKLKYLCYLFVTSPTFLIKKYPFHEVLLFEIDIGRLKQDEIQERVPPIEKVWKSLTYILKFRIMVSYTGKVVIEIQTY